MVNYQNSKIYIIKSPNTDKCYIGSTTNTLPQRMRNHRWDYNHKRENGNSVFEIFECGEAYIELLEMCPCNNKDELFKKENEIMNTYNNCVNKKKAYRSLEEVKLY